MDRMSMKWNKYVISRFTRDNKNDWLNGQGMKSTHENQKNTSEMPLLHWQSFKKDEKVDKLGLLVTGGENVMKPSFFSHNPVIFQ